MQGSTRIPLTREELDEIFAEIDEAVEGINLGSVANKLGRFQDDA